MRIIFRPYWSLAQPAMATPKTQPIKAELTKKPSIAAVSENCTFTKLIVPAITTVS